MKKTMIAAMLGTLVLTGCSTTKVVKDVSGSKIVDILHARYAEEVLQAMNRLADSQDINKVNVLTTYNQNSNPIQQSYSGQVVAQKKIVMPDTYPQKNWRNNKKTTTKKITAKAYKNGSADDSALTPQAKEQVIAQGNQLTNQNGQLITENKALRDDMKTTQTTAQVVKTTTEKELEQARKFAAEQKAKIEKDLEKQVEAAAQRAAQKIQAIEAKATSNVKPQVVEGVRKAVVVE